MTAYRYGLDRLYTIASQLSRALEQDLPSDSITYSISKGLRELYDNGICNNDILEMLMVKAWKLVLLTELANDTEDSQIQNIVADKVKDFVDSLEKLGVQNILRNKLGYE